MRKQVCKRDNNKKSFPGKHFFEKKEMSVSMERQQILFSDNKSLRSGEETSQRENKFHLQGNMSSVRYSQPPCRERRREPCSHYRVGRRAGRPALLALPEGVLHRTHQSYHFRTQQASPLLHARPENKARGVGVEGIVLRGWGP